MIEPGRWQMPLVCASCGGKQFEVTQLFCKEHEGADQIEPLCTNCKEQTYTIKQNSEIKIYYSFNQVEKDGE